MEQSFCQAHEVHPNPRLSLDKVQNAKLASSIKTFRSMHERVQIRLNFRTEQQKNECILHYSYECSTFLDLLYLDIAKMLVPLDQRTSHSRYHREPINPDPKQQRNAVS